MIECIRDVPFVSECIRDVPFVSESVPCHAKGENSIWGNKRSKVDIMSATEDDKKV